MSDNETSGKFAEEIERVVEYFRSEFDLSYSEAIGVLEMAKGRLLTEVLNEEEGEE